MAKNIYAAFWWDCTKDAFRGSINFANAWSGLWGPFLVYLFFYLRGQTLTLPDHLDGYALLLALSFLGTTWVGVFVVRLVGAPARLYATLRNSIPATPASDLSLALHERMSYLATTSIADLDGRVVPNLKAYFVCVTNNSGKFLQKCQVMFDTSPTCGHFDLRPNESRDMPVLWMRDRETDPRPIVFFYDYETGRINNGGGWLPNPSIYLIRAFSADSYPASLLVRLSTTAPTPPREWSLAAVDRSQVL